MPLRSTKSIIVPGQHRRPTFQEVAGAVLVGALCKMPVCVFCLSGDMAAQWSDWLNLSSTEVSLDVFDANAITLEDWQAIHSQTAYDIIVLYGLQSASRTEQLSAEYLEALLAAIPGGLVVMV